MFNLRFFSVQDCVVLVAFLEEILTPAKHPYETGEQKYFLKRSDKEKEEGGKFSTRLSKASMIPELQAYLELFQMQAGPHLNLPKFELFSGENL